MGIKNIRNIDFEIDQFIDLYHYIKYLKEFNIESDINYKNDENISELGVLKKLENMMDKISLKTKLNS